MIVGGGPLGMVAAICAARNELSPREVPSLGGQLQGKGVDVENHPGLFTFVMTPSTTTTTATPTTGIALPPLFHSLV